MNGAEHPFNFDINFGLGNESVFTDVELNYKNPAPTPSGFFLFLNGGNFLLLDGQNLTFL